MKLAAWARANAVHPQTAYRWFRQGRMPVPARRLPSGTILVEEPASDGAPGGVRYCTRGSPSTTSGLTWTGRSPGWLRGRPARAW